jgi:hypothetical protein
MDRLRCGVIYTDAFAKYLGDWWRSDISQHATKVPSLDFVHCKEGPRAGESWITLTWLLSKKLPDYEMFTVSEIPLHLPRQSQKGLKWRCLDARNGRVVLASE